MSKKEIRPHDETAHDEAVLDELHASVDASSAEMDGAAPDLGQLQSQLREAQEKSLRTQAELENFRKRIRRERDEERKYALQPIVRDLLPVIDNMERALTAIEGDEHAAGMLEGVKMVARQLLDALAEHGCVPIEAIGEPFDPMSHEAVGQQPSADYPKGTVSAVAQTGYRLHDRVIRPTHVIVSQGPAGDQ